MAIKKYSKVKFTLRKELIFIVAGLALVGLGVGLLNIKTKSEKFYTEWTKAGATSLTTEHPFVYTTAEKIENDVVGNTSSGLVYVFYGTSSNSTAQTLIATVETSASNAKVEKILVLDSAFASEKDREEDASFDAELIETEKQLGLYSYVDADQTSMSADDRFKASLDNSPSLWVYNNGVLVYVINTQLVEAESSDYNAALTKAFSFAYEAK